MAHMTYEPPTLELIAPNEDIRAGLTTASVLTPDGNHVDNFPVHEDKDPNWFDDVNNWGGD